MHLYIKKIFELDDVFNKASFDLAVEKIKSDYSFIGVQEMMDLSNLMLSNLLEVNINLKDRINIGSYDLNEIEPGTIEKIIKLNQADMKLYQFIVSNFLDRVNQL